MYVYFVYHGWHHRKFILNLLIQVLLLLPFYAKINVEIKRIETNWAADGLSIVFQFNTLFRSSLGLTYSIALHHLYTVLAYADTFIHDIIKWCCQIQRIPFFNRQTELLSSWLRSCLKCKWNENTGWGKRSEKFFRWIFSFCTMFAGWHCVWLS